MTNNTPRGTPTPADSNPRLEPDLRALELQLDQLALAERDSAPRSLILAVEASGPDAADAPIPIQFVSRRSRWSVVHAALAAGVLVAATLGVVWLATGGRGSTDPRPLQTPGGGVAVTTPSHAPASQDAMLDAIVAVIAMENDSLASEIDRLLSETVRLADGLEASYETPGLEG